MHRGGISRRERVQRIQNAGPRVTFGMAYRLEEVRRALGLVYENYIQQGYIDRNPVGARVTRYHLLKTTEILVAKCGDEVVCTMTLVRDNPEFGLPMDGVFQDQLDLRRDGGTRLLEVSCLASATGAGNSLSVTMGIMALTAQCSKVRGVDEIVIAVHPHHVDFYTRFLGFKPFGELRCYAAVHDRPAVALALDLNQLEKAFPKGYQRLFGRMYPGDILRYKPLEKDARSFLRCALNMIGADDPEGYRKAKAAGISAGAQVACA